MGRTATLRGARQFSVNLDVRAHAAVIRYQRAHGLGRSQAVRDLLMSGMHEPLLRELNEVRSTNDQLRESVDNMERELAKLRTLQDKISSNRWMNPSSMKRVR